MISNMVLSVFLFLYILSVACAQNSSLPASKEVCYKTIGCLRTDRPWRSKIRPIPLPWPPSKIATVVNFYTRPDVNQEHNITVYPLLQLNDAPYDESKETYFITHGFSSNSHKDWVLGIKDAILKQNNANVMAVDWSKGANNLNYLQAVANTQIVGREIGVLVVSLIKTPPQYHSQQERGLFGPQRRHEAHHHPHYLKYKARAEKIHLIGHSLGGQISGYIGKYVRETLNVKVGSITALDPAQTMYEFLNPKVRLTKRDALMVAAIHTSARPLIPAMGMGHITPVGQLDFYVNGGSYQPGCTLPEGEDIIKIRNTLDLAKYDVGHLSKIVACDHSRSHKYFVEAISQPDCLFWGHKVSPRKIHEAIQNVKANGALSPFYAMSQKCNARSCVPIGLDMHKTHLRGSFIVHTTGTFPFCVPEDGIQGMMERQYKKQHDMYAKNMNKTMTMSQDAMEQMNRDHMKDMENMMKMLNPQKGLEMEAERLREEKKQANE